MSMDLYIRVARADLERKIESHEARFRNEWLAMTAARDLEKRLGRERGRLEQSTPAAAGCCGRHAHAWGHSR
jgi:hypothetical protein